MYQCPKCGGTILGDGYSEPTYCEFADYPLDSIPDGPTILCDYVEDED
jgi:hypothetical protein